MANARSLGYLHQRMLERAEDAAAALRAAIGPTTTDLATLQQQSSGANNIGLHSHHHDEDEDDDSDDASLDDLDETDRRKSSTKKAAATNPYLAGILTSLDSSSDEARIDGLRRIIAAIAAGRYRIAHAALPAVLKLTSSSITSLHVRKLVSIILARSASAQPDLALLAVNSFQRDLSHHSPLIRASALKALGSLRIPVLAPILRLAIASAARDSNSHVRRIAALSLSKAYALDTSALPELVSLLALLFNDRSPSVLGAALVAYSSLGYPPPETAAVSAGTSAYNYDDGSTNHPPTSTSTDHEDDGEKKGSRDQYALLHPYFRKLCHALADMDEWAQSHALDVLLLYARANFSQPSGPSHQQGSSSSSNNALFPPKGKEREKQDIDAFFADDEPAASATVPLSVGASASSGGGVSPGINEKGPARRNSDLDLLLSKAQPLLMSRNPAVVLSVVKLTLYLSPPPSRNAPASTYTQTLIRPLLRYVRPSSSPSTTSNTPEVAYIALINLTYLITSFPALLPSLQPHLPAFLPRSASAEEPLYLSLAKVDVMVELCRENVVGARWVLDELEWLAKTADAASGNLGNLMEGEEEKEEEEEEGGGRLARRAVEAIGEVVERVRGDVTAAEKKEAQDRAEEEDLSQRALDILLRLIRGSSSSPTSRTMTTTTKTLGGKKNAGGMNKSVGEGGVQAGVVARAISVLRTLLQWRAPPVSLVPPTTGSTEQPASADELSTGRILANFPTLLFGPPSLTSSSSTTTTTSVNAEGKTVQIIRRPKVLGRNAIRDPEARANLFWLLGQHCRTRVAITLPSQQGQQTYKTLAELVGPDLLRRAALNFANESCGTKLQILTYATKLGTFLPTVGGGEGKVVVGLVGYVMQLGRYDADYDVRDRARFCKALTRGLSPAPTVEKVSGNGEERGEKEEEEEEDEEEEEEEEEEVGGVKLRREQVLMILFEGKDFSPPDVHPPSAQQGGQEPNIFGTLALALSSSSSSRPGGTRKTRFLLRGSQKMALPPWASPEEATPSSVRDAVSNSSSSSFPAAAVAVAAAVSQSSAPLPPRAVADSAPAIGAQAERAVEALASRAAKRLSSSSISGGGTPNHPVVGMAAPLVHASSSSTGVDARYKDLEDFLDDEDMEEVEVELDEDAPEDGEYEEEEEEEEEEGEVGGSHSRMLSGSESNAWAS